MSVDVRVLGPDDAATLADVAPDVFDEAVDARWSAEFLADPRHHLAVAVDAGRVVGMASGVRHVHPDKAPQLWINEVGVAPTHEGRGIGRRLVAALLAHARALGCVEGWVLVDEDNAAARRMYAAAGGGEERERPVMVAFPLAGEG
jgi:aminoglycoside 6'-N-acetyltransferase I